MCWARILFASSMNGRFCVSVSIFHSLPSRREISLLCIFGFSCAILRRWIRDQTMNAFIGRLMCSFFSLPGEEEEGEVEGLEPPELVGDIWVMADMAPRLEDMPDRPGDIPPKPAMLLCMLDMLVMLCIAMDMLGTLPNMLLPGSTVIVVTPHQYCPHPPATGK